MILIRPKPCADMLNRQLQWTTVESKVTMLTSDVDNANAANERTINDWNEALYNLKLANIKQEQIKSLLKEMRLENEKLWGKVAER